jgi:hypothetical protein
MLVLYGLKAIICQSTTEETFKSSRNAHLVHQNWYRISFTFRNYRQDIICFVGCHHVGVHPHSIWAVLDAVTGCSIILGI